MPNECMNKYRNQFAIEFAKSMQINLLQWKQWQKEHIRKLYDRDALIIYGIAFLVGFFPMGRGSDYIWQKHLLAAIVFGLIVICCGIYAENKRYQSDIKKKLFPILLGVFSKNIEYGVGEISLLEYKNSMLFDDAISSETTDDKFSGVYNDVPLVISESELSSKKKRRGGKTETVTLFKGLAMHFKMQKKIKSRVLIYSKSIFNGVPEGFEKVTMELESFNKKYNVYVQKKSNADGQVEARYLFNTVFLERFMQLQTSFRISEMQCSVYGDSMLLLLATNKDLFEMNHLFKCIDDIHQYQHLFDEFASVLSFIDVLNLSSRTGL